MCGCETAKAPRLLAELAAPDTLICRCEELSRAEIEAGIAPGSESIGAVKRQTRSGMGRCQGRYCGLAADAKPSLFPRSPQLTTE